MTEQAHPIPGYSLCLKPGYSSAGHFEKTLREGHFAVTTEISPPDSADPQEVFQRARVFDGYVDSMNATDGSGAPYRFNAPDPLKIGVCATNGPLHPAVLQMMRR